MEIGVEIQTRMQTQEPAADLPALRLLGPPALGRGAAPVALPRSRKVRALLAYLALAPRPVTRSHLCELLWDLPGDPRGELRWCLSKLRPLVDEPGRPRVLAQDDRISLDLSGWYVDALDVLADLREGADALPAQRLESLAAAFARGDLLEGLDLPRSPAFTGWLVAQRRRFRAAHAVVLEHWVRVLPTGSDAALNALERWLALTPFDRHAHQRVLEALAARGRLREAEEHLAAVARRYEAEGQDWGPIAHAWRAAKLHLADGMRSDVVVSAPLPPQAGEASPAGQQRASLAVLPFVDRTPGVALRGGLADGMAHDLITRLAKLRSVFVIAEGTMFALSERRVESEDAGRRLHVDYVASGALRRTPEGRLTVAVQLAETRSGKVVWADEFSGPLDGTFAVLDEIGNRIVSTLANQIEAAERNRAILKNPHSLNAWEAHHRGLWHMVRFNREDNEQARHFFQGAVRLDPTFARPYAGLSFTHFQDAFLGWHERGPAIERAYAAAAEGLMADEHDPAAHWALGRALWLRERQDEALRELSAAIALSPNFALGHYTLAFVHSQAGDPQAAIAEADHARALSPLDPLLFGMLASRALALARLGRHDEAADWAVRAAERPNAHLHIRAIATFCLALAGRRQEARALAQAIHRQQPGYALEDFVRAFKLGPQAETMMRQAAAVLAE